MLNKVKSRFSSGLRPCRGKTFSLTTNARLAITRCLFMIALVFSFAALGPGACDQTNNNAQVQIEYDQIANFYVYWLSPNTSTGAGDGMFIMYKIKKITNTGSDAKTFVFDKHKVLAVTPDKTSNEEPSGDNILLGGKLVTNLTVKPGETVTNPGCIIKHVLTPNPKSIESALVELIHQIDQSQPVSMKRAPGDNTSAMVGDAQPSYLQDLCGN